MTTIETRTVHTVTLEWPYKDALDKREFIHQLQTILPYGAAIIDLAVDDYPKMQPEISGPTVMRTLTIKYVDHPSLERYRRS